MRKNEKLTLGDLSDVFDQLRTGDDRSLVIVGGALVENGLESLLKKTLKDSEGTKLIISSTFRAKINTAEAVGIISKDEKQDLNVIIQLRNIFAHRLLVKSFIDKEAAQLIEKFHFYSEFLSEDGKRDLFKTTCQALIGTFIFCPRSLIIKDDEDAYERFYKKFSQYQNEN